jgi:type VI secretion system secreted protein VgrG
MLPFEAYEHHGQYERPDVDGEMATVHLQQWRAPRAVVRGSSRAAALGAGFAFTVLGCSRSGTRDGGYAVTRVRHEVLNTDVIAPSLFTTEAERDAAAVAAGCARAIRHALDARDDVTEAALRDLIESAMRQPGRPARYTNTFECVEQEVPFRPPRPRRTLHNVTETAVVVGPRKAEVHTDVHGRIKVQFHWDREGKWDDTRSCWIRVMQPWAGAGYGFQFFPRVGMEVLVTFVGGDPDRPVVVGALYNAIHPTPEALPDRSSRSGIRTQSTPGGGGFNELSFEDAKGTERIFLHAEKDLDEVVNDCHLLNVKNSQTITVAEQQEIAVGGQLFAVTRNQTTVVGENQSRVVRGSSSARVMNHETAVVEGDAFTSIGGKAVSAYRDDALLAVEGDRNVSVNGDFITQVNGRSDSEGANHVTYVQGRSYLTARDQVLICTEGQQPGAQAVRLECGESNLELTKDAITANTKTFVLTAETKVTIKHPAAEVTLSEAGVTVHSKNIHLTTPDGSSVRLEGQTAKVYSPKKTSVLGAEVNIDTALDNAGVVFGDDLLKGELVDVDLWLSRGQAPNTRTRGIGNAAYRVVADAFVVEGTTDAEGWLRTRLPKSARTASITVWPAPAEKTRGDAVEWQVELGERYPDQGEKQVLAGARVRLRNLGYEVGAIDDPELDDVTRRAHRQFQIDNGLTVTPDEEKPTFSDVWQIYGR